MAITAATPSSTSNQWRTLGLPDGSATTGRVACPRSESALSNSSSMSWGSRETRPGRGLGVPAVCRQTAPPGLALIGPSEPNRRSVQTSAMKRVRRIRRNDTKTGTEESQGSPLPPQTESWQDELMREWETSLVEEAPGDARVEVQGDSWSEVQSRDSDGTQFDDLDPRTVQEAKNVVAELIRAGDKIEEEIERLGRQGKLNQAVLVVIKNRFKFALDEKDKDVAQCMDLLYRRIKAEMLAHEASPAMRLLHELLRLKDDSAAVASHEEWLSECRQMMRESFVPENDPFSFIVPEGFDPTQASGPLGLSPMEDDGLLLRIDFIREVDDLLREVEANLLPLIEQLDMSAESIAVRLQVEERLRVVSEVRELREVAALLKI